MTIYGPSGAGHSTYPKEIVEEVNHRMKTDPTWKDKAKAFFQKYMEGAEEQRRFTSTTESRQEK